MTRVIIIFIFLTSGLFGQDNPMFDSLDYFTRNRIKTVHWYISKNFCSPGWDYVKSSFDKKTKTLHYDSIHWDPTSHMEQKKTSGGTRDFIFKDSIYHPPGFAYSNTIKHQFDKKGRLIKKIDKTEYSDSNVLGLSESDKKYTTTTEYFYADTSLKKIVQTQTKSPHFSEEINFFYSKNRLIKRVSIKIQYYDNHTSTDTFFYEYYEDGKLRKEARQLIDSRYKQPTCNGTIEYKYDTD